MRAVKPTPDMIQGRAVVYAEHSELKPENRHIVRNSLSGVKANMDRPSEIRYSNDRPKVYPGNVAVE
jgi:hypothetical protein